MDKQEIEGILNSLQLESNLIKEIIGVARYKKASKGKYISRPGRIPDQLLLILTGMVKVLKEDEHGNEVFLYYLKSGETCVMAINFWFADKPSQFTAIAEEDTHFLLFPMSLMYEWMGKYHQFTNFLLTAYHTRFDELMEALDSIAFMKTEERLFKYLLDKQEASGSFVIDMTQDQIARDLNTSRVVVSRLLKKLENADKIECKRNRIEIL